MKGFRVVKGYRYVVVLLALFLALVQNAFCIQNLAPVLPVVAITWNMGNQTAQDGVVDDLVNTIQASGFPAAILVGTQEELAPLGKELSNKLLTHLNKSSTKYKLVASHSHKTAAGANNALRTAVAAAAQETRFSKALHLPQNRTSLAILVKEDYLFNLTFKNIYYPPGKEKSNNSFIVIEGKIQKNGEINEIPLSLSAASVHLNSRSDKIRRAHANLFFQNHFKPINSYQDLVSEAKRFDVIMGDFNERDYLMLDGSVVDRGYLTNFMAYGYDFTQPQERPSLVYGTYGFTKYSKTLSRFMTPEALKDPRGRAHNAKGGFLDRIVFTSGLTVESPAHLYGAVLDPQKFEQKRKLLYAKSDHLPIIRYFAIKVPKSTADDKPIVKKYIMRRLPNFTPDIENLQRLTGIPNSTLTSLQQVAKHLMFYDGSQKPHEYLTQFSSSAKGAAIPLLKVIKRKEMELASLQQKMKELQNRLGASYDPRFFLQVFKEITGCNQYRNTALELIGEKNPTTSWYIPDSLLDRNVQCYNNLPSLGINR